MFRLLLALIGLAFVLFTGVGYFMKWYTVGRVDGNIVITVFPAKVEEGIEKIKNGAGELFDKGKAALTKPEDDKAKPRDEQSGLGHLFGPSPQPKPQGQQPQPPLGNNTFNSLPPASLSMPLEGR